MAIQKYVAGGLALLAASISFIHSAAAAGPDLDSLRSASREILSRTPGTEGVWEVDEKGHLHHLQSGMTCSPLGGDLMRFRDLMVSGTPHGDDVACTYDLSSMEGRLSIFATRHQGEDMDVELAATVAVMEGLFKAEPGRKPMVMRGKNPDDPTPKAASMLYTDKDAKEQKSSVWLNETGGWKLKVRATYPQEETKALMTEILASMLWLLKSSEILSASEN